MFGGNPVKERIAAEEMIKASAFRLGDTVVVEGRGESARAVTVTAAGAPVQEAALGVLDISSGQTILRTASAVNSTRNAPGRRCAVGAAGHGDDATRTGGVQD